MNPATIISIILSSMGGFVAIWLGILLLISHLSGWRKVASFYPASGSEEGKIVRFQSAHFGWIGYNNALSFLINPQGLGISILFPFRAGHPPLFIPWEEFHNPSEVKILMYSMVVLEVGDPVISKLRLPGWILNEYQKQSRRDS